MIDLNFIRYAMASKQRQLKNASTAQQTQQLYFEIGELSRILEDPETPTNLKEVTNGQARTVQQVFSSYSGFESGNKTT